MKHYSKITHGSLEQVVTLVDPLDVRGDPNQKGKARDLHGPTCVERGRLLRMLAGPAGDPHLGNSHLSQENIKTGAGPNLTWIRDSIVYKGQAVIRSCQRNATTTAILH